MVRHADHPDGIYALLRANQGLVLMLLWAVPAARTVSERLVSGPSNSRHLDDLA